MSRALPFLALVLAALTFFGYIRPLWTGDIAALKAEIASDEAALAAADAFAKQEKALLQERAKISGENLARLSTFLPDYVDNVQIILDLNALTAESGLVLSGLSIDDSASQSEASTASATTPQTPAPMSGAQAGPAGIVVAPTAKTKAPGHIDLHLTVSGTYAALQTFLQNLEHSRRLLDVRKLSIKGSDTGAYKHELVVRLYWLH